MLRWTDVMMIQERQKEVLREAEKRALVRQALMERQRRTPLGRRMLAAMVQRLINLVCYLLERYASALKVSVQTPCQEAGTKENL
jgi:hypothetical protein